MAALGLARRPTLSTQLSEASVLQSERRPARTQIHAGVHKRTNEHARVCVADEAHRLDVGSAHDAGQQDQKTKDDADQGPRTKDQG